MICHTGIRCTRLRCFIPVLLLTLCAHSLPQPAPLAPLVAAGSECGMHGQCAGLAKSCMHARLAHSQCADLAESCMRPTAQVSLEELADVRESLAATCSADEHTPPPPPHTRAHLHFTRRHPAQHHTNMHSITHTCTISYTHAQHHTHVRFTTPSRGQPCRPYAQGWC